VPALAAICRHRFLPVAAAARLLGLASSRRLTSVARLLLFDGHDATRLRLYQTAIFAKHSGYDETAWHTDLGTAPVDTNAMVTVWLPLERVPSRADGGTALIFARGLHRDLGGIWYPNLLGNNRDGGVGASGLSKHETARYGEPEDHGALEAGDATWHHGWALHAAPAPATPARELDASTATYMAADAKAPPL
jgi:ectoine hydroxylase-related dioxygenase (phytanoyl-CoA dioxygenase family)